MTEVFDEVKSRLEAIQKEAELKLVELQRIKKDMLSEQKRIEGFAESIQEKHGDLVDSEQLISFFKQPYAIIPWKKNQVLVSVPKFVKNFQVGWLWKETNTHYIYQFDQFSAWLGDAPKELLEQVEFKRNLEGYVEGNRVYFPPAFKEAIKHKLGYDVDDIEDDSARIIRGHEFGVLVEMIKNGCLPFKAKPIMQEDLREPKGEIKLRDYQKQAHKRLLETGAIGIFFPTGAGKSFNVMYAIDSIKGKKLIVVPSRTLIEQWNFYIEKYVPHCKEEVRVVTYQGFRKQDEEYALTIYDECHRLPSDTFSRLATIKTKYRMGLSASPYREDGRESYIFALTGYPVGLNWQEYMKTTGRSYHPIYVHIVRAEVSKLSKALEITDLKKKTMIFCDSIELGKRMASQFRTSAGIDVPYIYGETGDNRMEQIEKNNVVVVSRVADLGVSVKNLNRIIEIDFLYGSRQQELQRTGRLMHSLEEDVRHDIIMTEKEFSDYGKRIWALQEKGFSVKVVS